MPVATLDATPVSVPYRHREVSSLIARDGVTDVLIRVETDDGCVGWGEACSGADVASILAWLLPRYLKFMVYRALAESAAAEMGARMTAMDAASKNAGEMIDKLTLSYNRARQARITKELIEIVSGAAALE